MMNSNPTVELTGRGQTGKPRKSRAEKFAVRAPVERRVGARSFSVRRNAQSAAPSFTRTNS